MSKEKKERAAEKRQNAAEAAEEALKEAIDAAGEEKPEEPEAAPEAEESAENPLAKQLEEANAKTAEYLAMAQRIQADFENYRKRNEKPGAPFPMAAEPSSFMTWRVNRGDQHPSPFLEQHPSPFLPPKRSPMRVACARSSFFRACSEIGLE